MSRRKVVNILVLTEKSIREISQLDIDTRFYLLQQVLERAGDLDYCTRCHSNKITDESLPFCPNCKLVLTKGWAERRKKQRTK